MANYNHASLLPKSLGALLGQSYHPLEIIVVDDHSTDDSIPVLEDFAARHPLIKVYRNEQNLGVIRTSSRLTELAQGDYVLYTGADDIALPRLLEKSAAILERYPQAGLCSSGMVVIDEAGKSKGVLHHSIASKAPRYFSPDEMRAMLRKLGYDGWFFAANTAIYRRAAVIEEGGFRPELHAFVDGFLATVLALRHGACHVPEPLGAWRRTTSSYGALWGDPEHASAMVGAVASLIETNYVDLFPEGYLVQLRRGLKVKLRLAERSRGDESRRLRLANARLGRSPAGDLVLAVLDGAQRIRASAVHVWLRIRFRLPVRTRLVWKFKDVVGRLRLRKVF